MKAAYLNPIISSFASALESMVHLEAKKGDLVKKETLETTKEVTIIMPIEGDLNGYFTFGFTKETAMKVVETMTVGMGGTGELDELGISCLMEMAGITRGKIVKELANLDYNCEVKEGQLYFLEDFPLYPEEVTLEFNLETDMGQVELNLSLKK